MAKINKVKLPNGTIYDIVPSASDITVKSKLYFEAVNEDNVTYKKLVAEYVAPGPEDIDTAGTLTVYDLDGNTMFTMDMNGYEFNQLAVANVLTAGTLRAKNLTANRILVSDANKNIVSSGYEFDIDTNNTSNTWLLVMNGSKIQHRLSTNLSVDYATKAGTANNNILKNGDNGSAAIYWKETGYGDKFQIQPQFSGFDDSNYLAIRGATGGAGTDPSLYDLARFTGKSGNLWIKGNHNVDANRGYVIGSHSMFVDLNTAAAVLCANNGAFIRRYDNANTANVIHASQFAVDSSRLIKENVKDISDEYAKNILKLRPVSFDYIEKVGGEKGQCGMIAEEVLPIFPECVNVPDGYTEEKAIEEIENGSNMMCLSLDYAKFTPYLIKMVQIQQRQIEELKAEVEKLRDAIES